MTADLRARLRHVVGFLISGTASFATDVGITKLVGAATAWPWGVCRLFAIPAAMLVSWLCHRRLTFAVTAEPSLNEFARFVAMAWTAMVLNYLLFLAILWFRPNTDAGFAIFLSSLLAMSYSYLAMRFGVFARR